MDLRRAVPPDEPPGHARRTTDEPLAEDSFEVIPEPQDEATFRVPGWVFGGKLGAAVVVALLTLLATDTLQVIVGLAAAVGLVVYAARDLIVRVRLHADAEGVVAVHGYARRHRLRWSDIERVFVDNKPRLGSRTEALEVDAGTELFRFSRYDLGVDPERARDILAGIRARSGA